MRNRRLLTLLLAMLLGSSRLTLAAENITVDAIVARMMAHNLWQDAYLTRYTALRTFYAENPRFNLDATLLVETAFQQPENMRSKVLKQEGSQLIQDRVFSKILEAEEETRTKAAKREVDITPLNYDFSFIGRDLCDERPCYHLGVTPKHKSKYSLDGEIWIDAEDFAITRVHGNPSKRPSFWTTSTEIDRRYKRVDGIWLTDRIESTSNIMIAGHSHLKIDYRYTEIRTGAN
jgi:hypothetical protein